jgi:nitroreductase
MGDPRDSQGGPAAGVPKEARLLDMLLRTRRSVRVFANQAPPEALVRELIAAAVLAPSASNKQPWRFLVVSRRTLIDEMAGAVREAVARIAAHVPPDSVQAFHAYGDYFTRFEHAPLVIVPIHRGHRVLSQLVDEDLAPDLRQAIERLERDSGLVGTSLALMLLLLACHSRGLGASAMTGPLLAEAKLKSLLEVPASWGIVALVPLGYPAEEPAPTERKQVDKVTRWIR